jgi:outer membrane protein
MRLLNYPVRLLVLFTVLLTGCSEKEEPKIVFMDNFRIFEEFDMKKDYDKMIEQRFGTDRQGLDSMARSLEGIKDPLELARKKKELFEAQELFDRQFGELSDQYTQEVYARLNKYIEDYGKDHGYTFILGSNGQGSVMYVDSTANITSELIKYVNTQYNQ